MFFKKKKEEKTLPDLPPLKVEEFPLPRETKQVDDKSLPIFPDKPQFNKFSEAAIKDAVGDKTEKEAGELPSLPKVEEEDDEEEFEKVPSYEMQKQFEQAPSYGMQKQRLDFEKERQEERAIFNNRRKSLPKNLEDSGVVNAASTSDIFVKIDKYYTARKMLDDMLDKLVEIEGVIKKIREIKLREEQELSSWEDDITQIKNKINQVNENIFNKVG